MTTLELKVVLPERLARLAEAEGLLTPKALRELLTDAIQRRAAQALLAGAARVSEAGSQPFTMEEIQAEVATARRKRSARVTPHSLPRRAGESKALSAGC